MFFRDWGTPHFVLSFAIRSVRLGQAHSIFDQVFEPPGGVWFEGELHPDREYR